MTAANATGTGKERRRFPRYDVEIAVFLRKKTGDQMLVTADVSRHGAFIKSDTPQPIRQLVQLRFRLPDHSEIDAMCMVARWLDTSPRGSGFGVDFFALSKEAKAAWEKFLAELKARDASRGFDVAHTPTGTMALPTTQGVPLPPIPSAMPAHPALIGTPAPRSSLTPVPSLSAGMIELESVPDWIAPTALTPGQQIRRASTAPTHLMTSGLTPPPAKPPPPPPPDDALDGSDAANVVMLRFPDGDGLHKFIGGEIERGGMFLKTPLSKEIGDKLDIVLVHPESDEEFHLEATVVRRVMTGPADARGLGIFFRALSPEAHEKLVQFADSGVQVVELGRPISQRQVELESAVAREPDSAEALEALGSFLLDEEGDLGGALTALTRALVLGPSQVSIHAALARAYRKIGDHVKVRAHERVAEALMLHQDRLKVRLGVGDDLM